MYSSWNAFHYKPLTFNISCSIPSSEKRGFSLSLLFNFVVDCVHRSHSNQARLSKDEPTWLERTQLAWWRLSCIGFTKLLHFHVQALKTFTSVRSTKLNFKELFNSKIPISDFKDNSLKILYLSHFSIWIGPLALRVSVGLGVNYVAIECNFLLNHSKDVSWDGWEAR